MFWAAGGKEDKSDVVDDFWVTCELRSVGNCGELGERVFADSRVMMETSY